MSPAKVNQVADDEGWLDKRKQALARKLGRLIYANVARRASMVYLAGLASGTPNELTPLYNLARLQLQSDFDDALDEIASIRREWVDRCLGRDPLEGHVYPNVVGVEARLREQLERAVTGRWNV